MSLPSRGKKSFLGLEYLALNCRLQSRLPPWNRNKKNVFFSFVYVFYNTVHRQNNSPILIMSTINAICFRLLIIDSSQMPKCYCSLYCNSRFCALSYICPSASFCYCNGWYQQLESHTKQKKTTFRVLVSECFRTLLSINEILLALLVTLSRVSYFRLLRNSIPR